jgi:DNA ligase 1
MSSIIDVLEKLESDNSRLFKEELLEVYNDDLLLKRVFTVVGDPYTNFYINKFKAPKPLEKSTVSDNGAIMAFIEMLHEKLSTRQVTGNAAKRLVESFFEGIDARQAKWCQRILLKNLRCGVQSSTVNKVWPGAITKFSVQLAESLTTRHENGKGIIIEDNVNYPIRVEPKLDGLRCIAVKHEGTVTMFTRSGNVLETLPKIKLALEKAQWDEFVLDGEIMGESWNESASIVMSHKKGKDDSSMIFHVFDAMPFIDWQDQVSELTLTNRVALVGELVTKCDNPVVKQVPGRLVKNQEELLGMYASETSAGFEGVMLKDLDALYLFKRSSNIKKLKPTMTFEGVVIGHYEGNRGTKREGLWGGFEVKLPNNIVTRVGGGFTDKLKSEINLDPDVWIGRVVEVEGQPDPLTGDGLTSDGKIRFPVFIRERDIRDVDQNLLRIKDSIID